MTCKYTHTKFQPTNRQWRCPVCKAGPDHFFIESSVNKNCLKLHNNDEIVCTKHGGKWDGTTIAAKISEKIDVDFVTFIISQMHQYPQVEYDLTTQLIQLFGAAKKLGLYNATNYLRKVIEK